MKRALSIVSHVGSIVVLMWTLFGIAIVVWIAIIDTFKPGEHDGRFFQFGDEP